MKRLLFVPLLLLAGCSELLQYKPQPYSGDDPLASVERVLKEQPGDYAPVNLVVDPAYFELKRNRRVPVTVYFDSVGDVRIYQKGREYRVGVYDHSGAGRLWVITHREDQAQMFVDAMHELSKGRQFAIPER